VLVSDAIAYALRISGVLGVGQVALPQDTADALTALALMMAQWQRKRWLVYRLDEHSTAAVPGKGIYTIGPDPTADIPFPERPGSIESAFLRQLSGTTTPNSFPVDFPLHRIASREEWGRVSLKFLRSWPSSFFYDPALPNGGIYIWPVPMQKLFDLYFMVPTDIRVSLLPDTDLDKYLPAETDEALVYNLAMRLRLNYQLPPDPGLAAAARATLNTLRQTNYTPSHLGMPAGLRGSVRLKNPLGGFYPEVSTGVPYSVLR
jgi:hypothetical protein